MPPSTPKNGADGNEMDTVDDGIPKEEEEEEDEKPSIPQVPDAAADQEGGDVTVDDKQPDLKEFAVDTGDNTIEKPLPESKEEVTTTDINVITGMISESAENELERESKRPRGEE